MQHRGPHVRPTGGREVTTRGYHPRRLFRRFPLEQLVALSIRDADFTRSRSIMSKAGVDRGITVCESHGRNVVFDRAGRFHRISGEFDHCSFQSITTDACILTGFFRRCDFTKANLRKARLGANFKDCVFHEANLIVDSWYSSFERCSFRGCRIDDVFADVRRAALSAETVTFSVVIGGVKMGEVVPW